MDTPRRGYCEDVFINEIRILQELVDKQTPMKPRIEIEDLDYEQCQYGNDYFVCNECGSTLYEDTEHLKINDYQDQYNQDIEYYHCCGQKLDWSKE